MKKLFLILLTLSFSLQTHAELDLSYHPNNKLTRDEEACLQMGFGCTVAEEMEILRQSGKVLSSQELDIILSKDSEKSYFIPLSLDNHELLILAAATSLGVVAFKYDQSQNLILLYSSSVWTD